MQTVGYPKFANFFKIKGYSNPCMSRTLSAPNELYHLSSGNLKNPPLLLHRSKKLGQRAHALPQRQ